MIPLLLRGASIIPIQAWIWIAVALGVLYYGNWKERQGRADCQAEIAQVVEAKNRVISKAVQDLLAERNKATEAEQKLASILKEAEDEAKTLENADTICIPASITDKLRHGR